MYFSKKIINLISLIRYTSIRSLVGSTDQAYSSGFYFRIAWKSMEQTSVLWHFSLSFLRGLGSTNIKKVITSKKVRGIFWIIEIRVMLVVKCFGWRMQKYFSLLITNDWVWPHSVVDIAFAWFQSTISMTSLLAHKVAQPTKWRFLPKNLSQLVIFEIGLAFTWSWGDKNRA